MKFSDKLASLRKRNNLSQEQLAEKLDVSRQAVSKWESGDSYPDMAKILQLCKVLDCTLPDIMDDGAFGEEFNQMKKQVDEENSTKLNLSSYLKGFLEYVTRIYNMFLFMSFKQKMKCLFEMIIVGLILFGLCFLTGSLVETVLFKLIYLLPDEAHFYLVSAH